MSLEKRNEGRYPKLRYRSNETHRVSGYGQNLNPSYGPVGQQYGGSSYKIRDRWIYDYHNKPFREDGTFEPSNLEVVNRGYCNYFASGSNESDSLDNMWVATHGTASAPRGGASWDDFDKGNNAYALELLANTNPLAPLVMVPELIVELIAAVTVSRFRIKSSLFNPGSLYLTKVFGVDTLVEDIRILHKVTKHIHKRLSRLSSLGKHGGLREKMKLDSHSWPSAVFEDYPVATSAWTYAHGTITEQYSQKIWGTCRWRLKQDVPYDPEVFEDFIFAMQQVLDLEAPDLSTIWNLIPFSWVVDYFSSIGDYFSAIEGSDLIEAYDICIMRERMVTGRHQITSYAEWRDIRCFHRGKPYVRTRLRHTVPLSDALSLNTDFPKSNQVLNLIALLTQRFLK